MTKTEEDVQDFLSMIPTWVPVPTCILTEDGGVVLEWQKGDKNAVVSFSGNGSCGYVLFLQKGFKVGSFQLDIGEELSDEFLNYLRDLSNE